MAFSDWSRRSGVHDVVEPAYSAYQRARWGLAGGPAPAPSAVKRRILVNYAEAHHLRTLVETGTYKADTVRALRRSFDRLYSVEIDAKLFRDAQARTKGQQNADVRHGDSALVLPGILAEIAEPALFWLDAHYSGEGTGTAALETPIGAELNLIMGHSVRGHVVLIDDLREFTGGGTDYPALRVIKNLAEVHGYQFTTDADVIRLVPR